MIDMSLYKTEAIVLRSRDLGEADKVLTLYSRQSGKFQAVARGARRPRNRLVGASQAFTHCHLLLFSGRAMDTISQCEIREPFSLLREDLERMAYAAYAVELLEEMVGEKDANEPLFFLLLSLLHLLQDGGDRELLIRAFELRLLSLLGYRPRLERCVHCGGLPIPGRTRFSPVLGGLLCPACQEEDGYSLSLSPGTLKTMQALLSVDLRELWTIGLSLPGRQELSRALREYINCRLDRPLKSLRFLELLARESHGGEV